MDVDEFEAWSWQLDDGIGHCRQRRWRKCGVFNVSRLTAPRHNAEAPAISHPASHRIVVDDQSYSDSYSHNANTRARHRLLRSSSLDISCCTNVGQCTIGINGLQSVSVSSPVSLEVRMVRVQDARNGGPRHDIFDMRGCTSGGMGCRLSVSVSAIW